MMTRGDKDASATGVVALALVFVVFFVLGYGLA